MTRENLVKAIYDEQEGWSCPDNEYCEKIDNGGDPRILCKECAEKLLTAYETKIRADAINALVDRVHLHYLGVHPDELYTPFYPYEIVKTIDDFAKKLLEPERRKRI